MQLFIVSLARSTSRRETVLQNSFGAIQHQFFDAFDASTGGHKAISRYDEAATLRSFGLPLAAGEIACFASHYSLWQHCVSTDQPIAIMEDDVVLSERFADVFALAEQNIEACRFIRLCGLQERSYSTVRGLGGGYELVRFKHGPTGTQCYCLSPEGAALLLKGAERWTAPVDLYIDGFWNHGVASMAILPFEAKERDSKSPETTISGRQIRRSGWAKYRREAIRLGETVRRLLFNATYKDS